MSSDFVKCYIRIQITGLTIRIAHVASKKLYLYSDFTDAEDTLECAFTYPEPSLLNLIENRILCTFQKAQKTEDEIQIAILPRNETDFRRSIFNKNETFHKNTIGNIMAIVKSTIHLLKNMKVTKIVTHDKTDEVDENEEIENPEEKLEEKSEI